MVFKYITLLSIITICSSFPTERVINSLNQQKLNSNVKQSGTNENSRAGSENIQKLISEILTDGAAKNAKVNSQNVQTIDSVMNMFDKRKEQFNKLMNSLNNQNVFSKLIMGNVNANENIINSLNNQDISSVMRDKFGSVDGGKINSINDQEIKSLVENDVVGRKKGTKETEAVANANNVQQIDAAISVTVKPPQPKPITEKPNLTTELSRPTKPTTENSVPQIYNGPTTSMIFL